VEIVRIQAPGPQDFRAAADICELRWPYLKPLHTPARFALFARLGVELVVAREGHRLVGACFILPCRCRAGADVIQWVSPFQLASHPDSKNAGALIMLRIMAAYPAVISLGVTDDATRLYRVLRWKCYEEIWRGFHPINLRRMAEDYGARLTSPWARAGFQAIGGAYNVASRLVFEPLLAFGLNCSQPPRLTADPLLADKAELIAGAFGVVAPGPSGPPVTNVGGIGRVLRSNAEGWGDLRQHAAMWRQLRRADAKLCEVLIGTPEAKRRAMALGYIPIRMPAWYVEKNGMASKVLEAIRSDALSFLHTDKSV